MWDHQKPWVSMQNLSSMMTGWFGGTSMTPWPRKTPNASFGWVNDDIDPDLSDLRIVTDVTDVTDAISGEIFRDREWQQELCPRSPREWQDPHGTMTQRRSCPWRPTEAMGSWTSWTEAKMSMVGWFHFMVKLVYPDTPISSNFHISSSLQQNWTYPVLRNCFAAS